MVKAVDRAHAIGASAIQIFTDNPTAWRRRREPSAQLAAFRTKSAELDIRPVAIHASYLVNLPGPDAATFERSVAMLAGELDVRDRAGLLSFELGRGRILRRAVPALSPQERTETVSSLMRGR